MHVHKISKQKHVDFLKQNRKDPITGDLIVEGDEVVFCQECKSTFLKDTWEYLEGKHCSSKRTLAQFPKVTALNLSINEELKGINFLIRDIKHNTFEKVTKRLKNSKDWKERRVNFFFNKRILQNEFLEISFEQKLYKKTDYFLKTWGLLIFFAIWFIIPFSLRNCAYMVMAGMFYFTIWINVNNTKSDIDVDTGVKKEHPLLTFQKNSILLYYDKLQKAYSVDYQNITHFNFIYGLQGLSITTKDGQKLDFSLKVTNGKTVSFTKINDIIQQIQLVSKDTSIRFEGVPDSMRHNINKLNKENQNIWV
ncbi:hypothetical protein WAF17_06465 [Bernardetia sp. ABR2-2B]|uniref:hypothetical protein n=1 Tax=Bernardetia sp. ABR2-2B TaxID=3127472 RepID=UPI0030CCF77A